MNETGGDQFGMRFDYTPEMPADYVDHGKHRCRLGLAETLVDYLVNNGGRIVVELIEEDRSTEEWYRTMGRTYRCRLMLSRVQTHTVVMPVMAEMDSRQLWHTAVDEIKYRVKRWFKRQIGKVTNAKTDR